MEQYGGPGDKLYAAWTAKMALNLDVRVPWIMCKQVDAPDPIVCLFSFLSLCILIVSVMIFCTCTQ